MTFKPFAVCHWVFMTPLILLTTPAAGEDNAPPYYDRYNKTHVGGPYTAYRAGIGHTEISKTERRPLDGSRRTPPPNYLTAPAVPKPIVDWSGTYFGATVGGLLSTTDLDGALDAEIDSDSYVLSGHAGTNYQIGAVVFGGEFDASTTNVSDRTQGAGGVSTQTSVDWLASARLRAGVAVDNFLLYGTGGVAFTTSDVEIKALGFRAESKELHTGYVIGAGAEMAIVDGVNARVEALHYGFSGETMPTPTGSSNLDLDITTVRAGLSLKFK